MKKVPCKVPKGSSSDFPSRLLGITPKAWARLRYKVQT